MAEDVYIAFDYGTHKIGMAVGQEITKTATPLKTLVNSNGQPDWEKISSYCKQWRATAFVVGLPSMIDGREQFITKAARAFAEALEDRYHLPVHLVDERLTTKEAKQMVFEQGGYKKLKTADIDSLAAKLLLEQWLRFSH